MNLVGAAIVATLLGFSLAIITIFFLIRGASVPTASDKPQTIKYGKLELSTDRAVMLLIVSVVATFFPLGGLYYLTMKGFADVKLFFHANILVEERKPVRQATVTFQRKIDGKLVDLCDNKTVNGEFLCEADLNSFDDVFHLTIKKDGYADVLRTIKPNQLELLISLEPYRDKP